MIAETSVELALSTPLESTEVTTKKYVWLAWTVVSVNVVAATGEEFTFVYGPPLTVDLYPLYPDTVDALAVHIRSTECDTVCTPVPASVMDAWELAALLATLMLPGISPVAAGAKVTFRVAVCPGETICPDWTPLAV